MMNVSPGQQALDACPSPEDLSAFDLGQLPQPALQAIGKHIDGPCMRCEAVLEELHGQTDPLTTILRASQPFSPADAASAERVCERVLAATTDEVPPPDARRDEATVVRRLAPRGEVPRGGLHGLLRRRLRFATTFFACIYAVYLLKLAIFSDHYDPRYIRYSLFVLVPATFLGEVLAAWVLWSAKSLSLRRLRVIEWVVIGLPLLEQFCLEFQRLFLHRDLLLRDLEPIASGRMHVLPWFGIIIAYGALIPNTWRRCCRVVLAIAALGLGINLLAALADRVVVLLQGQHHLLEVGCWLAIAVAFAIYTCYRIEEARELGPYRLIKELGRGGMGVVYLAEHALLRRHCAIKLIEPEQADEHTLRRFEREVQKTARLTHPNTVQIFDYHMAPDGTFYYAMEYLDGLDLDKLVRRRGPLPPGRVVHLLRQVCGALAEAHNHPEVMIHRDIKPSNMMICVRGAQHDVCKLLDFGLVKEEPGLAHAWGKQTREGTIMGTPAFMSPEQASGQGSEADARSDLYSLGATAYFLLTGQPPFLRKTDVETLAAHINEPPAPLREHRADVPQDLETVLLRCLEKEPGRRLQSAEELDEALAGCACAAEWDRAKAAAWSRRFAPMKK
jgi:serine/threonine-protein kinase